MSSHAAEAIGLLALAGGVKFVGYSFAASIISGVYHRFDHSSFLIGGVRVLIGMVGGAICFGLLCGLLPDGVGFVLSVAALIPVRLIEWRFLIWLFYDRRTMNRALDWKVAVAGTVLSFVLDIAFIWIGGAFALTRMI
jgi:hypothetical protein